MLWLPQRPLGPRRGDVDAVLAQVVGEDTRDLLAEREIDPFGPVDIDREALGAAELDREHLDAGQGLFDLAADLLLECPFLVVNRWHVSPDEMSPLTKNGRRA